MIDVMNLRTRIVAALLLPLTLGLAGCGGDEEGPGSPATSQKADPYDVYRAHAPKGQKILSRQDAATRAKLGCGQTFPPGTVDAVLAEAYADYC